MKALFQHLADEEKEHVTEVYEALLLRDAAQKEWATTGAHAAGWTATSAGGVSETARKPRHPPTNALPPPVGIHVVVGVANPSCSQTSSAQLLTPSPKTGCQLWLA